MKTNSGKTGAPLSTRREFVTVTLQAGALLAIFPGFCATANADGCSFPYGSGLYGGSCYAGTMPKVLGLPPTQGVVQQDGFRFFVSGAPGQSYRIQFSSDLSDWTDLGNITIQGDGIPVEIHDADTANAERRFYRALPL